MDTCSVYKEAMSRYCYKSMPTRYLVILDLNGILVHREYLGNREPCVLDSLSVDENSTIIGLTKITRRPHLGPFLDFLFKHFDVALWSSALSRNIIPTLEWAIGKKHCQRFKFIWTQQECLRIRN